MSVGESAKHDCNANIHVDEESAFFESWGIQGIGGQLIPWEGLLDSKR